MNPLRTGSRQPPRIVREPGTTVHAQIEDWLAGQIATGALAPGDRLPAEQDLAGWFGVSRMTLRHALAELARRGLVTKAAGRRGGTLVAAAQLEQDPANTSGDAGGRGTGGRGGRPADAGGADRLRSFGRAARVRPRPVPRRPHPRGRVDLRPARRFGDRLNFCASPLTNGRIGRTIDSMEFGA